MHSIKNKSNQENKSQNLICNLNFFQKKVRFAKPRITLAWIKVPYFNPNIGQQSSLSDGGHDFFLPSGLTSQMQTRQIKRNLLNLLWKDNTKPKILPTPPPSSGRDASNPLIWEKCVPKATRYSFWITFSHLTLLRKGFLISQIIFRLGVSR